MITNERERFVAVINNVSRRFGLFREESSGLCALALARLFYPESAERQKLLFLSEAREEFREAIFEFWRLTTRENDQ